MGLYCSDVSGAFDKVCSERLLQKLELYGVRGKVLAFLRSWLADRVAVVVLSGAQSENASLQNMVFQGTVLGPPLWNTFFADVATVVQELLWETLRTVRGAPGQGSAGAAQRRSASRRGRPRGRTRGRSRAPVPRRARSAQSRRPEKSTRG